MKWQNSIGTEIKVVKGLRQGGLTLPLLYNMFYQPLVESLNECDSGIIINNQKYNIFCYADDLLLASTTITGLQALINIAVAHVRQIGLQFNPTKTICMSYGENSFSTAPSWNINGTNLQVNDSLKYLGTEIGKNCGKLHRETRINSANRAFYSLQGSGLYKQCISPRLTAHIYTTAVRSGLVYGCNTINMTQRDLIQLNKAQAKYIRTALGLSRFSHIKPVLQALRIQQVSDSIAVSSLELLRSNLRSSSSASVFYRYLMWSGSGAICNTLLYRAVQCCKDNNVDIFTYMVDNVYRMKYKHRLTSKVICDNRGLVDSVSSLFNNYNCDNAKLANVLLKPF